MPKSVKKSKKNNKKLIKKIKKKIIKKIPSNFNKKNKPVIIQGRCMSCLSLGEYVNLDVIKNKSLIYYKLIHDFNLQNMCNSCFKHTYEMYNKDRFSFLSWLMEFNNNLEGVSESYFVSLLKQFNITEELLSDDPDSYIDNLTKYIIFLQTLISIRRERDASIENEENISLPAL